MLKPFSLAFSLLASYLWTASEGGTSEQDIPYVHFQKRDLDGSDHEVHLDQQWPISCLWKTVKQGMLGNKFPFPLLSRPSYETYIAFEHEGSTPHPLNQS